MYGRKRSRKAPAITAKSPVLPRRPTPARPSPAHAETHFQLTSLLGGRVAGGGGEIAISQGANPASRQQCSATDGGRSQSSIARSSCVERVGGYEESARPISQLRRADGPAWLRNTRPPGCPYFRKYNISLVGAALGARVSHHSRLAGAGGRYRDAVSYRRSAVRRGGGGGLASRGDRLSRPRRRDNA